MIDLKQLRENPQRFIDGSLKKGIEADIPRLLDLDARRRELTTERERLRAEQAKVEKEIGPQIGRLAGAMKKAPPGEQAAMQTQLDELKTGPAALKARGAALEAEIARIEPGLRELLLTVPLPPDDDVPVGAGSEGNVEIRRWNPPGFDAARGFEASRGFTPKSHLDLVRDLGLADFERGVKMAGSRSYILTGDGFRLHQAVLRYAFDFMVEKHGFRAMSVPVLVREEAMVGTGFFPAGREQAYEVLGGPALRAGSSEVAESGKRSGDVPSPESAAQSRANPNDLFLTGTGEVGLMGIHQGEILDEATLPRKYVTVSTCFRREAGAAGKDTAGLYRIHQFDKVEQVVICRADEAESRAWHKRMIGYVEELLQSLSLPYRLLQCCTGDLGPKNADMVDIECWMPGRDPGRSALRADGAAPDVGRESRPTQGGYGETHSASRLYDYQCRRLNMRYRAGGEQGKGETVFCHSLNNTVAASPRILIPLLEIHQQRDGTVSIPAPLRPYMGGRSVIA
ncbi:MAG: serine--tRNA ligase [Phycisphaerales bacterium]|nr:serine--tRNA ligase [Phycisphaerales bacterium]